MFDHWETIPLNALNVPFCNRGVTFQIDSGLGFGLVFRAFECVPGTLLLDRCQLPGQRISYQHSCLTIKHQIIIPMSTAVLSLTRPQQCYQSGVETWRRRGGAECRWQGGGSGDGQGICRQQIPSVRTIGPNVEVVGHLLQDEGGVMSRVMGLIPIC